MSVNVSQKMMFVFLILLLIVIAFVRPIPEDQKLDKQGMVNPAGNIMVEIRWPDKMDVDVDLWVQSPEDIRPVGYSNRGGKIFNLLRDDRGNVEDPTELNYEVAYGRGLPVGEYTVNIHLYSNRHDVAEIPVTVVLSIQKEGDTQMHPVITRRAYLRVNGDEVTVMRFVTEKDGYVDPKSINDLFKSLREWRELNE